LVKIYKKGGENMLKKWLIFISSILLLSLVIIGCSRGISREEAFKILTKSYNPSGWYYFEISVGKLSSSYGHQWFPTAWSQLAKNGYINPFKIEGKGFPERTEITLTEKGKSVFNEVVYSNPEITTYRALVYKPVITEITGVSLEPDKVYAKVTFKWKYEKVSPIADVWVNYIYSWEADNPSYRRARVNTVNEQSVIMRKYDDGWRIE
jgi:hypothetical protein